MKKTMWIVSFMALIGTAIMLLFMPDRVPMHYDLAWNVDRWGSKYENLIFPIIILFVSLFWTLLVRFSEKTAANSGNEKEEAYAHAFRVPFPARSFVQVAAIPKGARLEVEAVATR